MSKHRERKKNPFLLRYINNQVEGEISPAQLTQPQLVTLCQKLQKKGVIINEITSNCEKIIISARGMTKDEVNKIIHGMIHDMKLKENLFG